LLGNIVFQTGNKGCFLGAEIIKELQKQQRAFVSQIIPPTGFFFLFCYFFLRENDGSASASRNEVALTPLRSLTPFMDTRELSRDTERDFGTFD
jgi:hypothetical protein